MSHRGTHYNESKSSSYVLWHKPVTNWSIARWPTGQWPAKYRSLSCGSPRPRPTLYSNGLCSDIIPRRGDPPGSDIPRRITEPMSSRLRGFVRKRSCWLWVVSHILKRVSFVHPGNYVHTCTQKQNVYVDLFIQVCVPTRKEEQNEKMMPCLAVRKW